MKPVSIMIMAAFALAPSGSASEARHGSMYGWPNSHSGCEEDILQSVSPGGDTLVTQSGHVFRVDRADTIDTQFWLIGDFVFVCTGEMVNKDKQGDRASVILMR